MMKSKWTKWQMGIVIAVFLFYLFQEVKTSPQFLAKVNADTTSKQQVVSETVPKQPSSNRFGNRTDSGRRNRDQIAGGSTDFSQSSPVKPHTRSQAS